MKEKNMRDLAEKAFRKIAEPMISHPEHLEVRVFADGEAFLVEPTAHFADAPKLIGKRGEMYSALTLIVKLVGWRNNAAVKMARVGPSKIGTAEFLPPFDRDFNWDSRETYDLFKTVVGLFLNQPEFKIMEDDESTWLIFKTAEKLPIVSGEIARSLSKIFHAIGKSRGRLIYVTDNIEEAKAKLNEASAKSN